MSIKNRLAALESRQVQKAVSATGASSDLLKQLQALAERIRDTPLSEITGHPSPISIAALMLDGRVDDEVARLCVEFSQAQTDSAKLFRAFLDAAGVAAIAEQ